MDALTAGVHALDRIARTAGLEADYVRGGKGLVPGDSPISALSDAIRAEKGEAAPVRRAR
jgi:hypothetical protein